MSDNISVHAVVYHISASRHTSFVELSYVRHTEVLTQIGIKRSLILYNNVSHAAQEGISGEASSAKEIEA